MTPMNRLVWFLRALWLIIPMLWKCSGTKARLVHGEWTCGGESQLTCAIGSGSASSWLSECIKTGMESQ